MVGINAECGKYQEALVSSTDKKFHNNQELLVMAAFKQEGKDDTLIVVNTVMLSRHSNKVGGGHF